MTAPESTARRSLGVQLGIVTTTRETIYRRNPQTAGRVLDGLAFVVTPDDSKLHTLNSTATRLWELAAKGCTARDAAGALCEHYEVDWDTALGDAETCLRDLVARQILVAEPP